MSKLIKAYSYTFPVTKLKYLDLQIERFSPKAKMLLVGTKLDLWAENEYNGKAISQDFIDGIAQRIGKYYLNINNSYSL